MVTHYIQGQLRFMGLCHCSLFLLHEVNLCVIHKRVNTLLRYGQIHAENIQLSSNCSTVIRSSIRVHLISSSHPHGSPDPWDRKLYPSSMAYISTSSAGNITLIVRQRTIPQTNHCISPCTAYDCLLHPAKASCTKLPRLLSHYCCSFRTHG